MNMLTRFRRSQRASIAVEFALIAPVFIALIGFGMDLQQQAQMLASVRFVVQSSATAGASALNATGGTPDAATAKAQAAFTANAVVFPASVTVSPLTITFANGLITVAASASQSAYFPMFTDNISASAQASD